jgi:PAS domain S-box-containing protein
MNFFGILKQENKHSVKIFKSQPNDKQLYFEKDEILVSKTNLTGHIIYGNLLFIKLSGYSDNEILGQPHNMIRHPDMPKIIFQTLWSVIQNKKEINAFVKNLAKDGSFYWVFANITPSYNKNNDIIGFYSVRRQPNLKAIEIIKPLYQALKQAETIGGVYESRKVLHSILEKYQMNFEELMYYLQYRI